MPTVATHPIPSGKLRPAAAPGHPVNGRAFRGSDPLRSDSDAAETPNHHVITCSSPRVLLADHHLVFLEGLQTLLEVRGLEVVGGVTNGADAVRLTRELRPDVAVLGIMLPGLNGVDAAKEIVRTTPEIGVVLLTDLTGEQLVRDALKAGVRGFVVKTQGVDTLIHTIREVSRGGMCVSPGPTQAFVGACLNGTRRPDTLSPREWAVLRLVAEGKTTKEAAALLRVSARTIDAHRASIMRTLGIHGTPGLVRYAIRQGLIEP